MPEVVPESQSSTPPGWIAGLPDTLKTNETFTKFKTVGEFANDYLATTAKVSDLEKKVSNSVPKLPDDASDEERGLYYDALGRPKQPSEYEFDGEDKNAPEWNNFWKQSMYEVGATKAQANAMSKKMNTIMNQLVESHNSKLKTEMATAETKLRSEWGDKFDTNVELAKRFYQKHLGNEFDKDFDAGTGTTRLSTIRLLVKLAALTGEDSSPQGGNSRSAAGPSSFISYDKSPAPPKR